MSFKLPAVILSGGSEVVSLSIAEALIPHNIPLVLIYLGQHSLIKNIHPGMIYYELDWPPESIESAIGRFLQIMDTIGAGQPSPWPVFATEDEGLRLLMEGREQLSKYLAIPSSKRLKMGGLDKAEMFEFLSKNGMDKLIAPSIVLYDASQALMVLREFGRNAIFKPALRSISYNIPLMKSKVITCKPNESDKSLVNRLSLAWSISDRWIGQPRLKMSNLGEAEWYGIRNSSGKIFGMTATERWIYPKLGGTACWVETCNISELHRNAETILKAIDSQGIFELAFLEDDQGKFRLIEINSRPWLQISLTTHTGHPLIYATYLDLSRQELPDMPFKIMKKKWVNVERMFLAALSGDYGARHLALADALRTIYQSDCIAIYDTPFVKIRRRWVFRMMIKAIQKFLLSRSLNKNIGN